MAVNQVSLTGNPAAACKYLIDCVIDGKLYTLCVSSRVDLSSFDAIVHSLSPLVLIPCRTGGVLIVMVIQIGLISPPVGMNLFVLNALLPNVGLGAIFRGVWPMVLVLIITLGILLAFPGISLWLPSMMD